MPAGATHGHAASEGRAASARAAAPHEHDTPAQPRTCADWILLHRTLTARRTRSDPTKGLARLKARSPARHAAIVQELAALNAEMTPEPGRGAGACEHVAASNERRARDTIERLLASNVYDASLGTLGR